MINLSVITVTSQNFNEIMAGEKPVLLDFYADWCGPCQMVAPIVHEIAEENNNIVVGKINVDDSPELAMKFGVMSIPTLIVMKNGEPTAQAVGLRSKEQILQMTEV